MSESTLSGTFFEVISTSSSQGTKTQSTKSLSGSTISQKSSTMKTSTTLPKFSLQKFTTKPTTLPKTTTTTTITTTTPVFSEKCGEFIKFDQTANQDSREARPDIFGFAGGVEYDNSPQYVGYGNNQDCPDKPKANPCSGYILLNTQYPGGRMTCYGTGMTYDSQTSYFILNHQNLKWVTTNYIDMLNEDALTVKNMYWKWAFGRIYYKKEYRIGKIQLNYDSNQQRGFYMTDENYRTKFFSSGFQILTCSNCSNGGAGIYCCLNGELCYNPHNTNLLISKFKCFI
jgi:hypothetical protein